ncbi:hypothetical protein ACHAXA_001653 [Cyclostephanos tholiformis]|uniref:Thioredoxin domain-containing protein n=1 Tax=Cyclostephanos tholiformis TaxID=382380 RepID=A0ABD3RVC1_9STRA
MTLHELADPKSLSSFISSNHRSLVCFSATWCGPCRASRPQLENLASKYASDPNTDVSCGLIYEHDLGDAIQSTYGIRAFPTYALYDGSNGGREIGRVQGVNFDGIRDMNDNRNGNWRGSRG